MPDAQRKMGTEMTEQRSHGGLTRADALTGVATGDPIRLEIDLRYGPVETLTGHIDEISHIDIETNRLGKQVISIDSDTDAGSDIDCLKMNLLTDPVSTFVSVADAYLLRTDQPRWERYTIADLVLQQVERDT